MKSKRPVIGVTGPDRGGGPAWVFASLQIRWQGGIPKRITPRRPRDTAGLHALLIGGGADVNPARYREEILKTLRSESRRVARGLGWYFLGAVVAWLIRRVFSLAAEGPRDEARDGLEFKLIAEACERRLPVLGICRGGQVINVHCGGDLHQDISGFYSEHPNLRTVRARKLVNVEPGSTLARIVGRPRLLVNSLHNQSVKTLGRGLRRAATEPNGVVQAIEHPDYPFLLGVQWHPEFLPLHREQRRIFYHLIEAARVFAHAAAETCPPIRTFKPTGAQSGDGAPPPSGP